jgi:hypothetical protein
LQDELQALAGPAAGPNGGQIYIDGFEGGQIPPKSAILEIRVNQNPFSAEYDRFGYGRIEPVSPTIIAKPELLYTGATALKSTRPTGSGDLAQYSTGHTNSGFALVAG